MAQASGVEKATFESLDGLGTFTVQFNPKELKLDEKASWKASDEHGATEPELTYEKGEPSSLSMELIFDTTVNSGGGDVNVQYVKPLRAFMTAQFEDSGAAAATGGGANNRPTYVMFRWGSVEFEGVIEKVNSTFLMFDSGGKPTRAKVQVGLKERVRGDMAFGPGGGGVQLTAGLGSSFGSAGVKAGTAKTYEVKEGDTLSTVAANTGAESRNIAEANGLGDPLNLTPGEKLVIPMNKRLARILARRRRNEPPRNYKDKENDSPFMESRAQAGGDSGPSALDETNPVGAGYDSEVGDFSNAYISFGPEYEGGPADGDEAIGEFGAAGSGEGIGDHSQHGANPAEGGPGAEGAEYDASLGDGSVGEYGAAGSGEGVGAHTQNGANPLAGGEGAEGAEYDAKLGDGSVGEYGAAGSGEGVGDHSQGGANPMAGGEGAKGADYDPTTGDGSVGEYGAAGSGEGAGAHTQGGADPMAGGGEAGHSQHGADATGEGMGAATAGEGSGEVGDDAIHRRNVAGAGDGRGDHSQGGADATGSGMGRDASGGGRDVGGTAQDAAGGGGTDGGQRGGGGGGGDGGAEAGGRRENGPEGSVDVDSAQMREDNSEADADAPSSGGGPKSDDPSKRDVKKHVAKKMEAKGEKPENVSDLKRGAKGMGLGEVISQAKDNAKDNPSE